MATYTTNLNLIKPADSDSYDIANDNGNMDKIDQWAGTTNTAISTINGKIAHIDQDTNITNLDNVPVNTQGRIRFDGTIRPSTETSLYNYECFGSSVYRTLIVSSITSNTTWSNVYNNGTWSGWQQITLKSDLSSSSGGVPIRKVGAVSNNDSFSITISNSYSSNTDFAIVCLNVSGNALSGMALLVLGKGSDKIKDLIGSMTTSNYTASYSNSVWTITNKSGGSMYYTAMISK